MKQHYISSLAILILFTLFSACQSDQQEARTEQKPLSNAIAATEPLPPMVKIAAEEEPEFKSRAASIPLKSNSKLMKMSLEKDSVSAEDKIRYAISDRVIDSLNSIVPIYDPEKYSPFTISYFSTLSEALHGRTFYADNPDSLVYDIMEILTSRLNEGTDIVFLIDKTGSMDDDIDTVKQNLNIIMDYLSKFSRVKVGMALYGDKNFHYDLWYNRVV